MSTDQPRALELLEEAYKLLGITPEERSVSGIVMRLAIAEKDRDALRAELERVRVSHEIDKKHLTALRESDRYDASQLASALKWSMTTVRAVLASTPVRDVPEMLSFAECTLAAYEAARGGEGTK